LAQDAVRDVGWELRWDVKRSVLPCCRLSCLAGIDRALLALIVIGLDCALRAFIVPCCHSFCFAAIHGVLLGAISAVCAQWMSIPASHLRIWNLQTAAVSLAQIFEAVTGTHVH